MVVPAQTLHFFTNLIDCKKVKGLLPHSELREHKSVLQITRKKVPNNFFVRNIPNFFSKCAV